MKEKGKKRNKTIITIIGIIFCLSIVALVTMNVLGFSISSAFMDQPDIREVDDEQLKQIKSDYLNMKKERLNYPDTVSIDNVYIVEYCGSYDGCIVMMISDSTAMYIQEVRFTIVGGVGIRYNDGNEILAWKDGELYTLEQAYANKILTMANIKKIRDIHNTY